MTGYSPETILARRQQIAACLAQGMTVSATARAVGCSRMTVNTVRKSMLATPDVQRIVQTAEKTSESVQSTVQARKPTLKPAETKPNPYHVKQRVIYHEVPRTVEAILSPETLTLQGVHRGTSITAHISQVKPMSDE